MPCVRRRVPVFDGACHRILPRRRGESHRHPAVLRGPNPQVQGTVAGRPRDDGARAVDSRLQIPRVPRVLRRHLRASPRPTASSGGGMTSGRKPKGPEPINIAASTKVNASEKAELLAKYGTMY